jgi:serine/threonine protein kinase
MSARHATLPGGTADATLPSAMHFERRLGKYTLTATLGEGAMGVVYRALDPDIDRVVAVKTIRRALLESATGNQSAALRFRNEARAVGRLSHPGIVSIFEYVEETEQSFIVMERALRCCAAACRSSACPCPMC